MKGTHTTNDIIKNTETAQLEESVLSFNVGDIVKVYNKIREGNRERIQIFGRAATKRQNSGAREAFIIRKNSSGIGVEKTQPLHSPSADNAEVVRKGKVREAEPNYLRDRVGKVARVRELVR